jgi:SMI1-KNR4 cell-wall
MLGKNMSIKNIIPNGTVSLDKIKQFEKQVGVEFPEDYVKFLANFNGGEPKLDTFEYKLKDGRVWTGGVRYFFGFNLDQLQNIDFFASMRGDRIPENMIPIGLDNGGNFILLTLSKQDRGKVYFWDHDEESEDNEPPTNDNIYFVANSFTEFLESLKEE